MSKSSAILPQNTVVIILNYCGADDTIHCVQSLQALSNQPLDIIVVDNKSPDDSLLRLQNTLVGVSLLSSPHNNGYASGNNIGIRHALADTRCRAVWILNNDTEVAPDSLDMLCACLNGHPSAGVAGATICNAANRDLVQCAGGSTLHPLFGTTKFCEAGQEQGILLEATTQHMDFVNGACQLVRREVFEAIGLLPEEYFMYYEDADFCIHAQQAGFDLVWANASRIWHKEGASSGANSGQGVLSRPAWVDYLELRNRVWLARKYRPAIVPIVCLSYFVVALRRILRKQKKRVPLVFRALWHGLTGKMGKPRVYLPTS